MWHATAPRLLAQRCIPTATRQECDMLCECRFEERKHEYRFTNQNADDIKIFWVCKTDKAEPYVGALHENTA